jgi:low temperature requirement protein LtrA
MVWCWPMPGLGHVLVIFGGPAIFLLGRGILEYAAFSHISWTRPLGVVALAALIPAALQVPITVTAALAAVVLAGVAIGNFLVRRFFPRAPSPPRLGRVPAKP